MYGMTITSDRKFSPKEAAAHIGVSLSTLREYIRKRAIRVIRRGAGPRPRVLIRESELQKVFRETRL